MLVFWLFAVSCLLYQNNTSFLPPKNDLVQVTGVLQSIDIINSSKKRGYYKLHTAFKLKPITCNPLNKLPTDFIHKTWNFVTKTQLIQSDTENWRTLASGARFQVGDTVTVILRLQSFINAQQYQPPGDIEVESIVKAES